METSGLELRSLDFQRRRAGRKGERREAAKGFSATREGPVGLWWQIPTPLNFSEPSSYWERLQPPVGGGEGVGGEASNELQSP